MDSKITETLDQNGYPLAFRFRDGERVSPVLRGSGQDVFKVEARQLAGHQKEAVVTDGEKGAAWRIVSDEGKRLNGTDLAPFPLGFFNAGIQCDLYRRLRMLADAAGISLSSVEIDVVNGYGLTGSFIHGTGQGHADPTEIEIRLAASAGAERIGKLVQSALDLSPTIAYLRTAMTGNTFALYINGRRRPVEGVSASEAHDAADPYRRYAKAPVPPAGWRRRDLIEKLPASTVVDDASLMPSSTDKRIGWHVMGAGMPTEDGLFAADTWLGRPGATRFRLKSDEGSSGAAPSGLALFSAGISFCYMTQLSRYIDGMKMQIGGVRLVQFNPYAVRNGRAEVGPIDTHLFLNGEAPEETHLKLLTVAAHTCYLHAAAKSPLEPKISLVLNNAPAMKMAV